MKLTPLLLVAVLAACATAPPPAPAPLAAGNVVANWAYGGEVVAKLVPDKSDGLLMIVVPRAKQFISAEQIQTEAAAQAAQAEAARKAEKDKSLCPKDFPVYRDGGCHRLTASNP